MFEHLNLILFSALNASAGLSGWQLLSARFAAEWLILLVPLTLAALWIGGDARQRQAAVHACLAAIGALAVNATIGLLWFHPRPFMAGVGHTFLHHAPDSSFPSDHATILFTVALALAFSQIDNARRIGSLLLPVAVVVAWARVFLGVHYPMDMFGALLVSVVVTTLFQARMAIAASAALVPMMESVYRRVLAAPIARGWLRP
ncbi:undecaprenyl-diphosphate phosphatase [Massilia terrae]|uniref:Phosphatase PAP2 family protein n=1 Tax=Massilia terrae TaxID=1811224 RepID=A0ABT2D3S6_9BURK|nr:phosphatase PAP2 family protein [Massilia terrae]MCS0659978.1 phosphatase PAP2 family protein [Massilia terrae]